MQIKTSKGRKFAVDWADISVIDPTQLIIQLQDTRPLGALANLFDGCETIDRTDESQGNKTFTGYVELVRIQRDARGVQITLKKAVA